MEKGGDVSWQGSILGELHAVRLCHVLSNHFVFCICWEGPHLSGEL